MTVSNTVRVFKFGGTSVGSAQTMRLVAQLVSTEQAQGPLIVVASAMSTVTDHLVGANQAARQGDFSTVDQKLKAIRTLHHRAIEALGGDEVAADKKRSIDDLLGQGEMLQRQGKGYS